MSTARVVTMLVRINGEPLEVADGTALTQVLAQLGITPERVAIELNRRVIGRAEWASSELHEGDAIEIVHFVGGGGVEY